MAPAASLLAHAAGVAASPIAVSAAIVLVLGGRAGRTAPAFWAGFAAGVGVVAAVGMLAAGAAERLEDAVGSWPSGVLQIAVGIALAVAGVGRLVHRRRSGAGGTPGWMRAVDRLRPFEAAGLGLLAGGASPKNLVLAATAGALIAGAGLSTAASWLTLVLFALLASATVLVPVAYRALAGVRAERRLGRWRAWLVAHDAPVVAVVGLALGALFGAQGLTALAG
jgi:hypothetical protein